MFKILLCLPLFLFADHAKPDIAAASEALGHLIGENLESFGLNFDIDAIVKGLKEQQEGKSSPMNEEECAKAIQELQIEAIEKIQDREEKIVDSLSNGELIQGLYPPQITLAHENGLKTIPFAHD